MDAALVQPPALFRGEADAVPVPQGLGDGLAVRGQFRRGRAEALGEVHVPGSAAQQTARAALPPVRVLGLQQRRLAGHVTLVGLAARPPPLLAVHGPGRPGADQRRQDGGHPARLRVGDRDPAAGVVLADQAGQRLPPDPVAGRVREVVLQDAQGGYGHAVGQSRHRVQHGVEHLGCAEEFEERAQRAVVLVRGGVGHRAAVRVEDPQHTDGGRAQR